MILISHRGNLRGRSVFENIPGFVDDALDAGYDAEIDMFVNEKGIYLGHDFPMSKIPFKWLLERRSRLWVHCKNFEALSLMNNAEENFTYFWHQDDKYTITSNGYIWAYPGEPVGTMKSIVVLPEVKYSDAELIRMNPYGICSDFIHNYRNI